MVATARRAGVARRIIGVAVLTLAAGVGRPLRAQANPGWKVPIELLQGFIATSGAPQPYLFSVVAVPGYSTPFLRAGLRVSEDYENPGWKTRLGVRLERQVWVAAANVGLVLGLEGDTDFSGHGRWGAGLTFDADGLVRAGFWGGWDQARDAGWFGIALGADPTSWFGCVKSDVNPGGC